MTLQLAEKKKITVDDLQYIPLKDGAHRSRKDGVCAMEAAAWANLAPTIATLQESAQNLVRRMKIG